MALIIICREAVLQGLVGWLMGDIPDFWWLILIEIWKVVILSIRLNYKKQIKIDWWENFKER